MSPSTTGSEIRCSQVSVQFDGGVRAVDDVSLTARRGEVLSLVGPSGCGKTTMLRLMAGLQPATRGSVQLDPVASGERGEVGFVFQHPALLKWRTALANVALPLELQANPSAHGNRLQLATEMLKQVELDDSQHRFPRQLSGGMRMRVSIARALVTQPRVLMLDEPFAALDDILRNQLGQLLLRLWAERHFTAVMVTHNIGEAIMLSHRIVLMDRGRVVDKFDNDVPWPRGDHSHQHESFATMYGRISNALREASA